MKRRITVEIEESDLEDALEELMDDRLDEAKAEAREIIEEVQEKIAETMAELKADLLDARRMLLRAQPSPSEALIYLERAIVTAQRHA